MAYATIEEVLEALKRAPRDFSFTASKPAANAVDLPDDCFRVDVGDLCVITRRSATAQATYEEMRARRVADGKVFAKPLRLIRRGDLWRLLVKCPCTHAVEIDAEERGAYCPCCGHRIELERAR